MKIIKYTVTGGGDSSSSSSTNNRAVSSLHCIYRSNTIMPGPRMGPRPADFDEDLVRSSPTYIRWEKLAPGEKLRYACREFTKGFGDDDERLMRRIMIARRNNLRDHEILKKARASVAVVDGSEGKRKSEKGTFASDDDRSPKKHRTCVYSMNDDEIRREMDVDAVERTRSYKKWLRLQDGQEFTYNQKYIKGCDNHDWLLKKNIWRRMRYRRENKKILSQMKYLSSNDESQDMLPVSTQVRSERADSTATSEHSFSSTLVAASAGAQLADHTLPPELLSSGEVVALPDAEPDDNIVQAAVAAAESYMKQQARVSTSVNPVSLKSASVNPEPVVEERGPSMASIEEHDDDHHHSSNHLFDGDALDVAAKLAAAASAGGHGDDSDDDFCTAEL
jgi:hypothetical protein